MREAGPIILFDGVCNLCNRAVDFVIARDPRGIFRFASLQSEAAKPLLARCGMAADSLESIVLVEDDACHVRSAAALRIARRLTWPWPALYALVVLPRPLRDAVYDWFARHRYRVFGRRQACRLPTPDLAARFL